MSRKSTMAQLVSVLALLGGCQSEKPATGPESMHMDANLVEITDISSKGENLHLISLRLSDKSGNSIGMTAGSTVNYLEGGRYSLVQDNIGNRDFTATADVDGQLGEIESGNLTVTRKNDSYSLSLALHSPGLEITASTKDKNIYFDRQQLDKMPKDENAGFTSGLETPEQGYRTGNAVLGLSSGKLRRSQGVSGTVHPARNVGHAQRLVQPQPDSRICCP